MTHSFYFYLAVMAGTTYALRALPLTLFRRPVENRYLRSFLYYVPYVTLALMTFPAIMDSTQLPLAGFLALLTGVALAWSGAGILKVSLSCCALVFAVELFLGA